MKKTNLLIWITTLVAISLLASCKKEENTIVISDAKSLNEILFIEGAKRIKGDIPVPSSGIFGDDLENATTEIIFSNSNGSFEVQFEYPDEEKIVFFKVDGTEDYFELTLKNDGSIAQKIEKMENKITLCCFCAQPAKFNNPPGNPGKYPATLQTCKLEKGKTKEESLKNKNNWSPPKKININTYSDFKVGEGEFTYNGKTVTGSCISVPATQCSSGIDVAITNSSATSYFLIYNMPSASSGTFALTEYESEGCNLFALGDVDGFLGLGTFLGGFVTKTGPKSFVFTYKEDGITISGIGSY
jgi:hypothetical protein